MIGLKIKYIGSSNEPALSTNTDYIVYGGEFSLNNNVREYSEFRIENDQGSIIPYDANQFIIIIDINNNYIINKIVDNRFKFNYKNIAYDKFWSMLYDEAGTSIDDFRIAKKELYSSELTKEEIKNRLIGSNIDERDFMANALIEDKNCEFIEYVIEFCNEELNKWIDTIDLESLFKYLSKFENDKVNEFFIKYLSENEKGHEVLDEIVYNYFEQ